MTNCFSCNVTPNGGLLRGLSEPFLGREFYDIYDYSFFYCAQPNATSASIQNIKTNLREYYIERVKLDLLFEVTSTTGYEYVMFFVLNVPQNYVPNLPHGRLSELPSHTIPENVLYYNLVCLGSLNNKNISIDIKKHFRVSPSYKLDFVCYRYTNSFDGFFLDGTAQVFFDVN